jgi:hypothetical protein
MRVIILTREKVAKIKKVDSKKVDHQFRKATYIIDSKRVQNYKNEDGLIQGAELIYFEDNPNPVHHEDEPEDLSGNYLDDVVLINFIQQTTDTFRNWNPPSLGFLKWFAENPSRIPFTLMFGVVAYTMIKNWLQTGGF